MFLFFVGNKIQMCYNIHIKCSFLGDFEYLKGREDEAKMKDAHASERLLLQGRKKQCEALQRQAEFAAELEIKRQNDRRGSPYETKKAADCRRF